jgi:hypothetical protein
MRLKHQVVTMEVVKRLKALGVQQDSVFKCVFFDWNLETINFDQPANLGLEQFAAFTVAELCEMLDLNQQYPNVGKSEVGDWFVNFTGHHFDPFEADARAAILVYSLAKDLIQVPAA